MKKRNVPFFAMLALPLVACVAAAFGQPAPVASGAGPLAWTVAEGDDRTERLEGLAGRLEAGLRESRVPGAAIAIVHGDEVIFARGFGVADVASGRPVTPETIFAVGSTTKAFTATLIGMLMDDGVMSWDDPVTAYLPEFTLPVNVPEDAAEADRTVLIRDLLAHRTGFARMGVLWATASVPVDEVLSTATQAEPWAPFRGSFHYNNVMFLAAGTAAGRAADSTWPALMQERLLGPLGMTDTTLSVRDAQRDERLALGYRWNEDRDGFEHLPMRRLDTIAPAGAINAHVRDMARWVRFQLARGVIDGRRLVSAERIAETWTPQIQVAPDVGYGFGWMLREWKGHRVVEHGGNIDGFAAQVAMLPDLDLGFVLLANVSATPLQNGSMSTVWEALLVDPGAPDPAEADGAVAAEDFAPYVGDYTANFGSFQDATFEVLVRDGTLAVDVPGQTVYLLEPPDADGKRVFSLTDQVAIAFERDDAGRVVLMKMFQAGLTFELPRVGIVAADEIDRAAVAPLLGTYRFEELGADVSVLVQNGRLAVDIPGQMVFEMREPDADGWRVFRAIDAIAVRFDRDDDGAVTALVLRQDGREMVMPRTGDPADMPPSFAELAERWDLDGRAAAVAAMGVFRIEGRVRFVHAGMGGAVALTGAGTDRYRSDLDFGKFGWVSVVVDGDRAWTDSAFEPFRALEGQLLSQAQLGHPAAQFGDWRVFYDTIDVIGGGEIDGRPIVVLRGRRGELPPVTMSVAADTGDLLKAESTEMVPGVGGIPTSVTLSDYRALHGIRLPRTISTSNDFTGRVESVLETMRVGLEEPPGLFRLEAPDEE